MSTVARCNAAFSGIAAGLIHLSLAAGRGDAGLIPLAALGVVEIVWSVTLLVRGRIVVPRTALAVTAVTIAGLVLALSAGLLRDPLPALAATALQLIAAAVAAAALRSPRSEDKAVSAPRAIVGLLAGALTVSALATPALAASSEGSADMGGMMSSSVGGHGH